VGRRQAEATGNRDSQRALDTNRFHVSVRLLGLQVVRVRRQINEHRAEHVKGDMRIGKKDVAIVLLEVVP